MIASPVFGCGCPADTSAKQKHRPRRQPYGCRRGCYKLKMIREPIYIPKLYFAYLIFNL